MNTHRTRRTVRVSLVVGVLLVSVVALSIAFSGTAVAQETLVVDGDTDNDADGESPFATIQEAVDNATSGDTVEIKVASDVYNESVTVNTENLTIQGIENGDKPTVYWSETSDPVFTIESENDNVTVRDLRIEAQNESSKGIDVGFGSGHTYINNTINGTESGESSHRGIQIQGDSSVVLDNEITNFNRAVVVSGTSTTNITIEGNDITDQTRFGVSVFSSTEETTIKSNRFERVGSGINDDVLDISAPETTIYDNHINESGTGIDLNNDADGSNVTGNTIEGNARGIVSSPFSGISDLTIESNEIHDSGEQGIWVRSGEDNLVSSNNVSESDSAGIELGETERATVQDNDVLSNEASGILLEGSSNTTVLDNTANDNGGYGIELDESDDNELRNNTARNNGWDIYLEDSVGTVVENLDIGDSTAADTTLSFEAEDVQLRSNATPPADPEDVTNIGRYFEAVNLSADGFLDVSLSYEDDLLPADVEEQTLELLRHDGTMWVAVPDSDVDTANNVVFANITEFSTFGAFAEQSEPEPESEPTRSSSSSSGSSSSLPPNAFAQRTMQIRDSSHGTPGTTVDIGLAGADSITFSDEDASGLLTARAYNAVPTDAPAVCEYQPFIAGYQFDVPADQATQPATIQFTVDGDDLADADVSADQLTVIYAPTDAEACESLETTVIDSNGDVTLEVETPGFSTFVISSTDEPEPAAESEPEPEEDEEEPAEPDETEQTEDNIPGFGVAIAVLVTLLSAALVVRRSGRRQ